MRRLLLSLLVSPIVALGLLALVPAPSAAATAGVRPDWGSTSATDAKIRAGCRGYVYSYALTPPDGDWSLETFLVGPHGRQYGSGYFVTGADPLSGEGSWRLCRRSTKGGTYTIRALLTVQNGGDYEEGWLPDSTFRLRKPR